MFIFCGQSYQNHSLVNLNVTDKNILECYTDKESCCKFDKGGEGKWLFPNGSMVNTSAVGDDFYRNRGQGVVNLNWRQNARIPTGLFCCEIPDPDQKACIGVYPEDMGNYKPLRPICCKTHCQLI